MIAGIDEMLSKGISFSLYMTHGGTNWGHWAGANSPGFAPDVTSYDYDAPIDESGRVTQKYHALRAKTATDVSGYFNDILSDLSQEDREQVAKALRLLDEALTRWEAGEGR